MSCAEDYLGEDGERVVSKKSSTKYNQPTTAEPFRFYILHYYLTYTSF